MFTKIVRLALTVISYAGRALAETERRYSQTEKNIFLLCGPSFILYTDDKTPGSNLWEPCLKQPSRIERWLLFTNFVSRANVGIKTQPISYRDIPQRSRTNTLMSQTLAYRLLYVQADQYRIQLPRYRQLSFCTIEKCAGIYHDYLETAW